MSFEKIAIPKSDFDTYFVTDVHGMYDLLQKAKNEIGYRSPDMNGNVFDRMISCGDLCDRGARNYDLMQMFRYSPDKMAIIGNHEIMGYLGVKEGSSSRQHWLGNGGGWSNDYEHAVLKDVFDWAIELPYAMEIEFEGGPLVGLVHAGIPEGLSWGSVRSSLLMNNDSEYSEWLKSVLVWDRSNFNQSNSHTVGDIDLVLHGHNVSDDVLELGNRIYFDTGAPRVSPGNNRCLTMLKYEKDGKGTIGNGWFSCHQFSIDDFGKLVYINY